MLKKKKYAFGMGLSTNEAIEAVKEKFHPRRPFEIFGFDGSPEEFRRFQEANLYGSYENPFVPLVKVADKATMSAEPIVIPPNQLVGFRERFIYYLAFTGYLRDISTNVPVDDLPEGFIRRYGLDNCTVIIKPYLCHDLEPYEPEEFKKRGIRGGYLRPKKGPDGEEIIVPQAGHDDIGWIVTCGLKVAAPSGVKEEKAESKELTVQIRYSYFTGLLLPKNSDKPLDLAR